MNNARTIRVFLSSTFRDFGEERDLLVRRVFPSLRARLKDRCVDLVDVDLRWGITAQEAERGEVLPICLAEIDRARPYFIGMLGERYGWIPPPESYAADLLERQPWLKIHQGGKSVTELEILHGVLNNRRVRDRAFFYFRSRAYARAQGGHYLAPPEDRARQSELKRHIRDRGLSVTAYANPEALAQRIEHDLWTLLDAAFPAESVPDAFQRERLRHDAYAAPKRRLYLGAERHERMLERALTAQEPRIVIEGVSGSGKSALLANFFAHWRPRYRKHLVHEHYLAASADAADPYVLVRRLIEFIQRVTGSPQAISGDPQHLLDSLPLWLATASAWTRKRKTRFIVVIDSLNSLSDRQDLRWWPASLPEGITLVVSCLAGPLLDALKRRVQAPPAQTQPKWRTLSIGPLTRAQSVMLLNAYLARFNKKLPAPLVQQVRAHPLATNPLFVRTLAEELRLFGEHEALQNRLDHYLSSQTFDDLFERVLQRVEKDCGKKQVRQALTAIWTSRTGLTEKEILGIAQLTPSAWAGIRHALDESLVNVGSHINFAHEYLRAAVRDGYLGPRGATSRALRPLHAKLYGYFLAQVDPASDLTLSGDVTARGLDVFYHLLLSANRTEIARLVDNAEVFYRVVALTRLSGQWDITRSARAILGWSQASPALTTTQRERVMAHVLTAASGLSIDLLGRHIRFVAGQSGAWDAPVGIEANEALGREAVVFMSAVVRWWIVFIATCDAPADGLRIHEILQRLQAVSRSGVIDDLDGYFAAVFRKRMTLLTEFIVHQQAISPEAVRVRLAVISELTSWGESAVAERLSGETLAIQGRLGPAASPQIQA